MEFVKKFFICLVVVAFAVFVSSSLVVARENGADSTDSGRPKPVGFELREKKTEFLEKKDELKEREASKRAELKEKKIEMLKKRFANLSRHLKAYLLRLDKISDKISRRIVKLNARGVDTSRGQAKLDEAKLLRDLAGTAIDKAIVDAQSVAGATDIKAATDTAVASVKDAKAALFAYHKKLVEATRELKASRELREGTGSAEKD